MARLAGQKLRASYITSPTYSAGDQVLASDVGLVAGAVPKASQF